MYSRSYYPESQDRPTLPNNYDGTAFAERAESQFEAEHQGPSAVESEDTTVFNRVDDRGGGLLSGLGRNPILSGLFAKEGLLGGLGLSMPCIGTEEILIIATAAFLFFSKSGDRECALILLLLLFIN